MEKEERIQVGDRITYKNINEPNYQARPKIIINEYDIAKIHGCIKENQIDILKIERPKYEIIEEKEELLTEEEKKFLKQYSSFANYAIYKIKKDENYLLFIDGADTVRTRYEFYNCFKNLDDGAYYTLKELGLEEN